MGDARSDTASGASMGDPVKKAMYLKARVHLEAAIHCEKAMNKQNMEEEYKPDYNDLCLSHVVRFLEEIHFGPGPDGSNSKL